MRLNTQFAKWKVFLGCSYNMVFAIRPKPSADAHLPFAITSQPLLTCFLSDSYSKSKTEHSTCSEKRDLTSPSSSSLQAPELPPALNRGGFTCPGTVLPMAAILPRTQPASQPGATLPSLHRRCSSFICDPCLSLAKRRCHRHTRVRLPRGIQILFSFCKNPMACFFYYQQPHQPASQRNTLRLLLL